MIELFISYIQSIIITHGAVGIFVATILEEIIAPIPSPIIPLLGGFFLLTPYAGSLSMVLVRDVVLIAIPVTAGIGLGSSLVYALGYYGGKPLIEKNKRWLGITWESIERVERRMSGGSGDEIVLFFLRILPIVPGVAISGLCGIIRYPFCRFIVVTLMGTFVRASILGIMGWRVGELYQAYADFFSHIEKYLFLGFVIVLIVGSIFYRRKNRKK